MDLKRNGGLEQLAEFIDRKSRILDNTAHRESLDGVVPGDGDLTGPVGHHDVLALPDNPEPRLLQGADRILVVDAGNLGHGYTCTSTSRISASRMRSSRAAKYSRMA